MAFDGPATPQTLGTDAAVRGYFLDRGFPPGYDRLLSALAGTGSAASFMSMPHADQVAALRRLEELSEMERHLVEQGVSPDEIEQCLGNHARTQMGLPNARNEDIDLLLMGYNGSRATVNSTTVEDDPFTPLNPLQIELRHQEMIEAYVQGQINRMQEDGAEPVTSEEVEEYAQEHGINPEVLKDRLRERGIEIEEQTPAQALMNGPGMGLVRAGIAVNALDATMSGMGGA